MDIVERLRAEAAFARHLNMQGFEMLAALCTEAADEIEKLRREAKPLLNAETALSGRMNQEDQ